MYDYLHRWLWFDVMESYVVFHFWKTVGMMLTVGILIGRL